MANWLKLVLTVFLASMRNMYVEGLRVVRHTGFINTTTLTALAIMTMISSIPALNSARVSDEQLANATTLLMDVKIYLRRYQSPLFKVEAPKLVHITKNQPMYIGIKTMFGINIKVIIHKCFATPTADMHGEAYIFFRDKCPLDKTLKIIESRDDVFNFVISPFNFSQLNREVFIHCQVLLCEQNSTSPNCRQKCLNQKLQPSVGSTPTSVSKYVSSGPISFIRSQQCSDLTCQNNSRCFALFPAICRCEQGYVFSSVTNRCINQRLITIKELKMNDKWLDSYGNPFSSDFIRFSVRMEKILMQLFATLLVPVEGVKVVSARKGSVILEIMIIYFNSYNREDVRRELISHLKYSTVEKHSPLNDSSIIPATSVVTPNEHKLTLSKTTSTQHASALKSGITILITAIVVPLVLLIVILLLLIKLVTMRRLIDKRTRMQLERNGEFMLTSRDFDEMIFVEPVEEGRTPLNRTVSDDSGLDMVESTVYIF